MVCPGVCPCNAQQHVYVAMRLHIPLSVSAHADPPADEAHGRIARDEEEDGSRAQHPAALVDRTRDVEALVIAVQLLPPSMKADRACKVSWGSLRTGRSTFSGPHTIDVCA